MDFFFCNGQFEIFPNYSHNLFFFLFFPQMTCSFISKKKKKKRCCGHPLKPKGSNRGCYKIHQNIFTKSSIS